MLNAITQQAQQAVEELLAAAKLNSGDIVVIGCSSSEIVGEKLGTASSAQAAQAVYRGIVPVLRQHGLFCAVQCCEHLNRALIVERACQEWYRLPQVNVVPHPHAGGAFATCCYENFDDPVAVERVEASAGMDIGDVFIGMHLLPVVVPVRGSLCQIGRAHLTMCRRRPKFVGGQRATYDPDLL